MKLGDSTVIECQVENSNNVTWGNDGAEVPREVTKTMENNIYKLT